MISLARADGARKDLLEAITHAQRGDIVDVYTEFPWAALCAEVEKLRIERKTAQIVELRAVAGGAAGAGPAAGLATVLATAPPFPLANRGVGKRPQGDCIRRARIAGARRC